MTNNVKNGTLGFVLALMSAEVLGVFEVTMLLAAMRYLLEEFKSPIAVGWMFSAFGLSSAMFAAIGSRVGDIFGRKRLLLFAIAFGGVGSLVAATSSGLVGVVLGRVMQGSSGVILPLCVGLVRENLSDRQVPVVIGALTATITVSAGFALLIAGVILDHFSWRGIFYAGACAALVALTLVFILVPNSTHKRPAPSDINYLGGLLFAPGLASLLVGITYAKSWGWVDIRTLSLILAGIVLLFAWIRSELKAKIPLINVRLLANQQIAIANIIFAILAMTVLLKSHLISLLLQQPEWTGIGLGHTATFAGLVMLPASFISLIGGPGAGWGLLRFGPRTTLIFGSVILLGGWVGLSLLHSGWIWVGAWALVAGFGLSIVYSSIHMVIAQNAPPDRTSEAIGIPTVVRSTFMGLGAQVIAGLLATSSIANGDISISYPDEHAFGLTMVYMVTGCFIIIIVASLVPRKTSK